LPFGEDKIIMEEELMDDEKLSARYPDFEKRD